jgi:hypothetical protein
MGTQRLFKLQRKFLLQWRFSQGKYCLRLGFSKGSFIHEGNHFQRMGFSQGKLLFFLLQRGLTKESFT